jgi:hypothetical protein
VEVAAEKQRENSTTTPAFLFVVVIIIVTIVGVVSISIATPESALHQHSKKAALFFVPVAIVGAWGLSSRVESVYRSGCCCCC